MRPPLLLLLLIMTSCVAAQGYSFTGDFQPGTIFFKDAPPQSGQVKWFPSQNQRLRFRENEKASAKKFGADEITGFTVDSLEFRSVHNFEVFAEGYPLLGKTSLIKHTFAELIDTGSFNIYLVITTGADGYSGVGNYANYLFEKRGDTATSYAAYPVGTRMRDKRYEQAKENLYVFFKDYSQAIEKIRAYKQQDDLTALIDFLKTLN